MKFTVTLVVKQTLDPGGYQRIMQNDPDWLRTEQINNAYGWMVGLGGMLDPEYIDHRVRSTNHTEVIFDVDLYFSDYSAMAGKLNTWFTDPFFNNSFEEGKGYRNGTLLHWASRKEVTI